MIRTLVLLGATALCCSAALTITPATLPNATVGVAYQVDVDATGGSGDYHWTAVGSLPTGLTLADFSSAADRVGRISGTPTTAGSFTFTIVGADQVPGGASSTKQYTIVVQAASGPLLKLSATALSFDGFIKGDAVGPQAVGILPTGTSTVAYSVTIDDGSGGAAPAWVVAGPLTGTAPGRLLVSADPSAIATAGTLRARLRVLAAQTTTPLDITITFNVTTAPSQVDLFPTVLRFASRVTNPGNQSQPVLLRNSGGTAPIPFHTDTLNHSPWLSVSPVAGTIAPNSPAVVTVTVNTNALPGTPNGYRDSVHITFPGGARDVNVILFVGPDGPILQLSNTSFRFRVPQGGRGPVRFLSIEDTGSATSQVNWSASITGTPVLTTVVSSGTAMPGAPSNLTLSPTVGAAALSPNAYYNLITVSDPNARNSPQFAVIIVEVVDASQGGEPEFIPSGATAPALTLVGVAGGPPLVISTNLILEAVPAPTFIVTANANDGGKWLSVKTTATPIASLVQVTIIATPPSGNISTSPKIGINTGEIDVLINGAQRSIPVTFIVLSVGATPEPERGLIGCNPSSVAVTPGQALPSLFSVPAGWPATLTAVLNDNCGQTISGSAGSIVARFDNGDPPLTLTDPAGIGVYTADWTPIFPQANVSITFNAGSGALQPGSAVVVGGVNANKFAPPQLFDNGTVNNTNPLGGALLAPGTVASAYGKGLATSTVSPGVIPLVTTFNGTTLNVGGRAAPLYFLSDGQLNIQIPPELAANQQYAVAVQVNNAFAVLPNGIALIPATPGVSSFADGHIIAQHADFTLIDAAHPAKPGEPIVTYLSGMGLTTPFVAAGQPASATSLTPANILPAVAVDGQGAELFYSGLTPSGIGLFQINFAVPATAKTGDLNVVVMQNGIIANITKLPVAAN
jgi:uncharacterized protein (TIGR03437 family)